ncbi:MAG: phage terminase small subunit P27 family [Pseudomonadota bacterium]
MKGTKPTLVIPADGLSDVLPPPDWLGDDAAEEWIRVQPILAERRILTDADLGSLENYCVSIGLVREAERYLQDNGPIVETESGPKRSPAVGIQKDGITMARQLAAELGLTPVSRSRPSIREVGKDDEVDPLNIS